MTKTEALANTFQALAARYGCEVTDDITVVIPKVVNEEISVNSFVFELDNWAEAKDPDGNDAWALQIDDCLDLDFDVEDDRVVTPLCLLVKDESKSINFKTAFNATNKTIIVFADKQPTTELFAIIIREYFMREDYDKIVAAREAEVRALIDALAPSHDYESDENHEVASEDVPSETVEE